MYHIKVVILLEDKKYNNNSIENVGIRNFSLLYNNIENTNSKSIKNLFYCPLFV